MMMGDPDMGTHGLSIIASEISVKLLSCSYEFSMPGEEVGQLYKSSPRKEATTYHFYCHLKINVSYFSIIRMCVNCNLLED